MAGGGDDLALFLMCCDEIVATLDDFRLLEFHLCCQRLHLCHHLAAQCCGVTFQNSYGRIDVLHVFLMALVSHTRSHTVFHVVFQTEFIFPRFYAFFTHGLMAAAYGIQILEQFKKCVEGGNVTVGSEIHGSPAIDVSCFEDTGQVFLGDSDGRVGLSVFQQDVVARLELLDELVL